MKFVWGILAGGGAAAALLWVVLTLTEPQPPTQSAVIGQPAEQPVDSTAPSPGDRQDARATVAVPDPAGDANTAVSEAQEAKSGSSAGQAGPQSEADRFAASPGEEASARPGGSGEDAAGTGTVPVEGADGNDAAAGRHAAGGEEGASGRPDPAAVAPAGSRPDASSAPPPAQLAALAPAAPTAPADALSMPGQATTPAAGKTPRPPADAGAPSFDIVRVDASGQTVIAGQARPGQLVEVLLDGEVVETVEADGSGRFVAVIRVNLSGEARQLQLRVTARADDPAAAEAEAGEPEPAGRVAQAEADRGGNVIPTPEALAAPAAEPADAANRPLAATPSDAPATASGAAGPAEERTAAALATAPEAPVNGVEAAAPKPPARPSAMAIPRPAPGTPAQQGGTAQRAAADQPARMPSAVVPAPRPALPSQPLPRPDAGDAPSSDRLRVAAGAGDAMPGAGAAPEAGSAPDGAEPAGAEPAGARRATSGAGSTGPADGAANGGAAADGSAATGSLPVSAASARGGAIVSDAAPSVASKAPSLPAAGATPRAALLDHGVASASSRPGAPADEAPAPLAAAGAVAGTAAGASPDAPAAPRPAPEGGGRYLLSAPVLILPTTRTGDAPALVRPETDELALLQPGGGAAELAEPAVVLDQISYGRSGDVQLRGRGQPRHAVRIYGDGRMLGSAPVRDGGWAVSLPRDQVEELSVFRVDEIGPAGQVTSRIEAPFRYTGDRPLVLREREVVVQRGDNLWEIAEHYYGEGIRYSLIYGANSELIRDPDLIYPEQVFSIPELVEAE